MEKLETNNVDVTIMETHYGFTLDIRRLEKDDVPIRFFDNDIETNNDYVIDDFDWQYSN